MNSHAAAASRPTRALGKAQSTIYPKSASRGNGFFPEAFRDPHSFGNSNCEHHQKTPGMEIAKCLLPKEEEKIKSSS